ncbi:MAG: alpha/beta hydrolase [Hyphomicrobiaceae bacterium]
MRTIAPLHPEAKRILEIVAELEKGIVPPVPVPEMRAIAKRRNQRLAAEPAPVGRVENSAVAMGGLEVPIRVYWPDATPGQARPVYVHAHGGGFVVGDLDMADPVCRSICRGANTMVISVDYRLAPEHKFPAGLDDMIATIRWVARNGADIGIDTSRIAVGGDSAGGNLAAAAAQALAGELGPALRYQVLVYPVTDLTCSQPSYKDLGTGYPLTEARMLAYRDLYLGDASQAIDARASPLLAASVADQPPALVILAGLDPLVDEGRAYAQRLSAAGVATEISEAPGHPHGFLGWTGESDASRSMLDLISARLGKYLA